MGTEEQFQFLVAELAKLCKLYEDKGIKYYQYTDKIDHYFSGTLGWKKESFYKELNKRMGIQTNETRTTSKKKK